MTEIEKITAHMAAVEVLASSCFAFLLASAGNDPDLSKAKAILAAVDHDAQQGFAHLPPEMNAAARSTLSDLLNRVMQNLQALHGINQKPLQ